MSAITPYILPSMLINSPTGIDWSTLPDVGATDAEQLATQYQMCMRATQAAEAFCNQVLRATIDVQTESGPHRRLSLDSSGVARLITDQWPVLAVVSASSASSGTFPAQWRNLTSNQYDLEYAVPMNTGSAIPGGAAQGGNAIRLAPGFVNWSGGRRGFRVSVRYLNGWPLCGITQACDEGATVLHVDDVTGYTIGSADLPVIGTIEDGANTEVVSAISTSPSGIGASGPGTVTLAAGTAFAHAGLTGGVANCMLTTMPTPIQTAVTWLAISQSLIRGATFIAASSLPGSEVHSGAGESLDMLAYEQLLPFKRVV